MAEGKLTTKQEAFIAAYLGEARFNATKAAIMAGYSEKTAQPIGAENLSKPMIQSAIQAWRDEAKQAAITEVSYRINRLDDLESRLWDVVADRSAAYANSDVIGGDSGLVVRTYKVVGGGENAQMVEEYQVDTGLIREIRALHEQAAKETGQWLEKHEHSGSITREFVLVPDPGSPGEA
jgi:Terminase small subunit